MAKFASALDRFAKKAPNNAKLIVDKVCIDLLRKVVMRTPVGNREIWASNIERKSRDLPPLPEGYVGGRLRGNWNTGIGRIDTTDRPAAKSGRAAIRRARLAVSTREPDSDVYLTNSLPYAERIEYDGHSSQAPAGMLRVSVAEFSLLFNIAVKDQK